MSVTKKRIIGAGLLLLAGVQCVMVTMNDHTRRLGGHDLRPMLLTASLFAIGGFGMVIDARWAQLISSLLLAGFGLWLVVRDAFIAKLNDPVVSVVFGLLLCIPAIVILRHQPTRNAA